MQDAVATAEQISAYLLEAWGVEPLLIISGNGAQLQYRIDEPPDTPLVKQVLDHLHEKFSTDKVAIDTSVSDASRITRLPGTLNCKGDNVPGRPRRLARLLSVPNMRWTVSTEQLAMLAPETMPSPESKSAKGDWTYDKLRSMLDNQYRAFGGHDWDYQVEENAKYGTMFKIQQCPFVQHHVEYRAALWLHDGVLCYKCFSPDCDGVGKKTGGDFARLVAPEPPLALTDELRLARHVLSTFSQDGIPALRYYRGNWYLWDGCWQVIDEDQFVSRLYATCKDYILKQWPPDLVDKDGNPKPAPRLGKTSVANVSLALKSLVIIQDAGWVDGRGGRWIAFRDQLLDLDAWIRDEVVCIPQTPEYFAPNALHYPLTYTEEEPTVLLEKLRDQVTESEVATLQEFGGYSLTSETAIQRMLYIVGPPRSLKGTFERVIRATVGEHNTVSKTFASFLGAHALENVPAKTFLGISDSRPDPKLSRQAVERLLSISGEDPQDINPKGKAPYTAKLICKIGIASNIIADFADPTGALLSRFLFVETTKSYAANPDPKLLEKILAQQNEITWWFLRGLRRLLNNGKYTEPENSLRTRFQSQTNPIPHFIAMRCKVTGRADDKLSRDELFEAFETWCIDHQIACPGNNVFFRELYAAYPTVKGREHCVSGILFLAA